ncbi:MAG TPA: S8 family serine peptidase, partial [Thermoplasmata archaeon]|nr:S8 family serine peptidase [Thermoplasmata archaeon]
MARLKGAGFAALACLALVLVGAGPQLGSPAPTGPVRVLAAVDTARTVLSLEARPLPPATDLALTISLQPRDGTALIAFDRALQGPRPPSYLGEAEFERRFGAPANNVTALETYFAGFGARDVVLAPDHLLLRMVVPARGVASAFATDVLGDRSPAGLSWSPSSPPSLPSTLGPMVFGVGGLSGSPIVPSVDLMAVSPRHSRAAGSFVLDPAEGGSKIYTGADFVQAYRETGLFPGGNAAGANATYPTGEAVATILMSGYNDSSTTDLPPWDPAQISDYFNDTFSASWPHPTFSGVPITIGGRTPPPPGPYATQNDSSFDEAENSLDIEMAGSAAPGAEIVNFYFAASLFQNTSSSGPLGPVADDFATALGQALSYNYAGHRLDSVTNSFGLPDLNDSAWNLELAHAAAIGVTVVAASGDQGNAPSALTGRFQGQWPSWPATAAFDGYGTVSVGGVSVDVSGIPTGSFQGQTLPDQYDPNVTGLGSQATWYNDLGGRGNITGSEGGLSVVVPEPPWQFHSAAQPSIASAGGVQGATRLGRAGPDVAFPANSTIAYVAHDANGTFVAIVQGTSIASPFFAGLLAEWSAVAHHPFGWIDPALYRIAGYFGANPIPGNPFLDVTAGANFQFSAAPGWDATTGWGGIDGGLFLAAYSNSSIRTFNYTGPTPGLPTLGSVTGSPPTA